MLKDVGLDGYFTNHSLRRPCATHLFQAGESTKIVKEIMGHISDAVNKYECTSDEQHMNASSIIQKGVKEMKISEAAPMEVVETPSVVKDEDKFKLPKFKLLIASKSDVNGKGPNTAVSDSVGQLVENAIRAVGNRKDKITLEVELME